MTSLKRGSKWYLIGGLLALSLTIFLAACSTSSTPIPIPTSKSALVPEPATPSPIPTTQPTLVTEPATPSPIPIDTPTPTPSPIATPTPTPEPDGVVIYKSGIMGTTSSFVVSGVPPCRGKTSWPGSIEFAIAPMDSDSPAYDKAIFVTSEADGRYKVDLAPGKYWIGPKGIALDPINFRPGPLMVAVKVAVVKEGVFAQIDISEFGVAPGIAPTPHPDGVVTYNSGIAGTTSYFVVSGVPGGGTTGGRRSLEFAIAPIDGDITAYDKAIFVTSDADGTYKVDLPPGKYWIGSKGKALNPINYTSGAVGFLAKVAVVNEGAFTQIDVCLVGFAPGVAPTPESDGVAMHNSGITGTTISIVVSGVPGGGETVRPISLEFAIAPFEGDSPAYDNAIFVTSDADGTYKVDLAPGTYWIGPKWKALDRINYNSGPSVFSETVAVVKEEAFTQIDLSHTGYLP